MQSEDTHLSMTVFEMLRPILELENSAKIQTLESHKTFQSTAGRTDGQGENAIYI